ncbi:hypothetical protein [Lacticaseibacillus paracasei]|uniref:hypothetical protein n=1 Tax=Lacticaseibacillus paracasei TaxID=1597 RepID=UPI0011CB292F|nr:hypothetical protein [Lacticaseibacillus paracasei]TXJ63784.1 hypothetical protein FGO89_14685 [Lacticaseibacillus paracasei]
MITKLALQLVIPNWTVWSPIAISLVSLVFAIASFGLAFKGYQRGKPKIKVSQTIKKGSSMLIEPSWSGDDDPDIYTDRRYRVLMEVSIRNQSSNPIAISTFTLNNHFTYGPYALPGSRYEVEERAAKHSYGSLITYGGNSKIFGWTVGNQWIRPVVHLKPFDIVKGYIFWPVYEDELKFIHLNGKNTLTIETTFKNFDINVEIPEFIQRDSELSPRNTWRKEGPFN